MAILRVQTSLERITGLPEDRVVNTFHFSTGLPQAPEGDYDLVINNVLNFFAGETPAGAGATGGSIFGNLSNLVGAGQVHTIKVYNLSDPMPRPPRRTQTFSAVAATGTPLPADVALVLSQNAAFLPGTDPKRRRGRTYIGPLAQSTLSNQLAGGDVRPSLTVRNAMANAGKRLMDAPGPTWVVWSPTYGTSAPIERVRIDDQFDTQRRRGGKPTEFITRVKAAT
jgi:hypothetical protein